MLAVCIHCLMKGLNTRQLNLHHTSAVGIVYTHTVETELKGGKQDQKVTLPPPTLARYRVETTFQETFSYSDKNQTHPADSEISFTWEITALHWTLPIYLYIFAQILHFALCNIFLKLLRQIFTESPGALHFIFILLTSTQDNLTIQCNLVLRDQAASVKRDIYYPQIKEVLQNIYQNLGP